MRLDDLEAAYREHGAAFERVATAITGDESLGADAVHDAFVRAVRSRNTFRGDAPLVAWLWRIVLNEARRSTRPRELGFAVDEPALDDEDRAERDLVRSRIAALPERQRLALFLRYYADLDYDSIARALGIRPGTVAATLNAAHRRLATELEEVHRWTS